MTLQERLTDAQQRAQRLYLQRQAIEAQRIELHQRASLIDQSLLKTDGAIEVLEALIAEQAGGAHGV